MAFKVLIVDDDQEIIEYLKNILLRHDYEVISASDGEEGLRKVQEENPDVVLLDLVMPKLNGFEVLQEIRQKYKDKWRPVIIISAKTELDSVKRCYNMEADHYLTKPCKSESILRGIQTMISLIPLHNK
ncbi:MAG: response regulator [Candidatus Omnitrophota bacterium]|jgi:DNA-binding response OmpR family regulator|nr:MAG: response regulator [Candidatus Omnitrophota bacterium]